MKHSTEELVIQAAEIILRSKEPGPAIEKRIKMHDPMLRLIGKLLRAVAERDAEIERLRALTVTPLQKQFLDRSIESKVAQLKE